MELTLDVVCRELYINAFSLTNYSQAKKEIKRQIKKSKYVDYHVFYFDDIENDNTKVTWVDMEGIGYGWLWAENWLREKSEWLQKRAVTKNILRIWNSVEEDIPIVQYSRDGSKRIGFIMDYTSYFEIRLSENELSSLIF